MADSDMADVLPPVTDLTDSDDNAPVVPKAASPKNRARAVPKLEPTPKTKAKAKATPKAKVSAAAKSKPAAKPKPAAKIKAKAKGKSKAKAKAKASSSLKKQKTKEVAAADAAEEPTKSEVGSMFLQEAIYVQPL